MLPAAAASVNRKEYGIDPVRGKRLSNAFTGNREGCAGFSKQNSRGKTDCKKTAVMLHTRQENTWGKEGSKYKRVRR